jgi:DNA-binding transcriptional LysR family regulator
MKITTRQLQVFDAVANYGGIRTAANKLGMSQSAVSSCLADFQIILRRPLFVHVKGRPLQITDEGERLRSIVRSLLGRISDLELSDTHEPIAGTLIVGATALIAETVLPSLCIAFRRSYSGARIRVEVDSSEALFAKLTRFELETAVSEYFPIVEQVELTKWRTDELVLVVAPDHPLAGRKGLTMQDLAGMSWCTRETNSSVTARLRSMLHETIGELDVVFESTNNWSIRHAVCAGGGIGCLSTTLVQADVDAGRLIRLDVADFRFLRPISLARPRNVWRSRLATAFDQFLLEHGDEASA